MDRRLAEFLSKRFADSGGNDAVITITHEQIAAELGTAREVVSRVLKEFERSGTVELSRGKITLRDKAGLESFMNQ